MEKFIKKSKIEYMTQKKSTKKVKKRKQNSKIKVAFWICLALVVIPILVFGWILVSAALDTGTPILGSRYKNDLDPAITKSELEEIKSATNGISGVEKTTVELATATLRVYADVDDTASVDTCKTIASQVYSAVTSVLDPSVYFSQHDDMKMYDLEVHVYTKVSSSSDEDFNYVIETKTSSMSEPITQVVSEPIDAELAQQLRDDVEARKNPTPTPTDSSEMQVSGEEVEPTPTPTDEN